VQAVIFDYARTLVSFDLDREDLVRTMAGALPLLDGPPITARALVDNVLMPLDHRLLGRDGALDEVDYEAAYAHAWVEAGHHPAPAALHRIMELEQDVWRRSARLAPEALPTLAELRRRGLRLGVCSNSPYPGAYIAAQLRHLGIADLFDAVVVSADLGRRKPAPEIYRAALDGLAVPPAEALFVGDQVPEDYDGPRLMGMRAVICTALRRDPRPPEGAESIPDLSGVLSL
jgi:putative hydrolase of the HAD superfamily